MKRRRFEIDTRLLVAAVAALIAGLGFASVTRPPATVDVVTASGPVPPGVAVGSLSLTTTPMVGPTNVLLATDLESMGDHVLATGLADGDPLLVSLLRPPPGARHNTLGLTLKSEQAVHGHLEAGDTVAVYALRDELPPLRLASSVTVLAAGSNNGGLGSSDVAVLLAVDNRQALDLIRSTHEGSLYLVRLGR